MCGQLKVVHLAQADHSFLEQLQAAADKPPYSTNISLRNEWCIAPEVSNGSFMQSWFLAGKIDSFSGMQGILSDNPELWRSVPNDAFFSHQLGLVNIYNLATILGEPADSRLARGPGYCTAAGTIAGCLYQRHAHNGSTTHAISHPGRNSTCQVCWSPS
jgi:hypothetical protein